MVLADWSDSLVLGSLFLLVIIAGLIKVYFSKRRCVPIRSSHSAKYLTQFDRLKQYTKKAEEDALGAGEERVELNKRELDEGDLFGIRAIQSGYFGGVAQSRPSSIAEDRSDRDSTASNTLLGSHQSPERKGPSPMSSVVTLPLEARTASPLRHTAISAADPDRPRTSKRQGPHPIKSALQPSDAQINRGFNHDPAVNMSLNVPPSPGATSRRSSGYEFNMQNSSQGSMEPGGTMEHNPQSDSIPQNSQYGGHYIPTAAPETPVMGQNRSSVRPVTTAQNREYESYSQHPSVVNRDSDAPVRDNNRALRSSIQEETAFSTRPVRSTARSSIQEESDFTVMPTPRSVSSYRPYATRTSSYDYQSPDPLGPSPPRDHEGKNFSVPQRRQ